MAEIKEPTPSGNAIMLYNRGMDAFDKDNLDYAITLFISAVKDSPGFVKARNILRLSEYKQLEKSSPVAAIIKKFTALLVTLPAQSLLLLNVLQKDWIGVMTKAEDILKEYPKNVHILSQLANAAEMTKREGMILTAIDSYEKARRVSRKNLRVLKTLARIYRQVGDLDRSRACFEDIRRYHPHDKDIERGLKDLAALGTIARGGLDDVTTYRTKIRDEEQSDIFEKESRLVKSKKDIEALIANTEKQLQSKPDNTNLHKKLAELYIENRDFSKAINTLEIASRLDEGDITLKRTIASVKVNQFDEKIKSAEEKLKNDPQNNNLKFEVQRLIKNKSDFIISDLLQNIKQYPSNLILHFKLGNIYFNTGEFDKAIAEFQLAVKNPQRRISSMNKLGLCFKAKKMYDMAINQFKKAIQSLREMDTTKKEVIYNLGNVYEEMKEWDKAIEQYKKIYEVDINYRDIAQKIENVYKQKG
ncbi:MAG: tetratricopeptide repeat protein [Candidatus Aureabacteria bacterium]|nr:tetratricopeptide repeat protein [Candidatus Auribacterota bacterium]